MALSCLVTFDNFLPFLRHQFSCLYNGVSVWGGHAQVPDSTSLQVLFVSPPSLIEVQGANSRLWKEEGHVNISGSRCTWPAWNVNV